LLLAWESCLGITQSMILLVHLIHRRALLCRYSTRSQAVTLCHSLLEKVKKSAWDTWGVFPDVTNAFLEIANAPSELSDDCVRNIERFVVLLYDKRSELKSVDEARQQLFCKRSRSLDRIPPTSAALKQHTLRASYQGGHVWSQVHLALPELSSPAEWGWERNGQWKPVWTTLPQAQQSCYKLIHCSCRKACRGLCKCSKANLQCTALCACGGDCYL